MNQPNHCLSQPSAIGRMSRIRAMKMLPRNLIYSRYSLFIFIILSTLLLVYNPFLHEVFAKTPSFVLQEIEDKSDDSFLSYEGHATGVIATTYDGSMLKVPFATNMSQCKIEPGDVHQDISPNNEIKYVSYSSNGEVLNGKIWLSKPVYSLTEDSLSHSLWWKHLLVLNIPHEDNLDFLDTLVNRTISAIQARFNILASDRTLIANKTSAHIITYEYRSLKDSAIYTSIITLHNNKGLIATYHVPRTQYIDSSELVQDMLDWIFIHPGYLTYNDQNNGMRMEYPIDWTITPEDETGFRSNFGTTYNSSTYFFPGSGDASLYPSLYLLVENIPPTRNISSVDYVNADRANNLRSISGSNVTSFKTLNLGENLTRYEYEHTYKLQGTEYRNLNIILRNNEKIYYLQYKAKKAEYLDFLPIIKKMIESIRYKNKYSQTASK